MNRRKFNRMFGVVQASTIAVVALMLCSASNCTSLDSMLKDKTKVTQIASVLKSGTQFAVSQLVLTKPELTPHFKTATVGLKAAVGADALSPDEVLATVKLYMKEDPAGSAFYPLVESGMSLALNAYRTFYTLNVDDNVKPYLKELLMAISDGIELGTSSPVPAAPPGDVASNPILTLGLDDLKL